MRVHTFIYGVTAFFGMGLFLLLEGPPVFTGVMVNKVAGQYKAAGIDASGCTFGGARCLEQPMRTIATRFAEPVPAGDADDLSDQPPGEAPD